MTSSLTTSVSRFVEAYNETAYGVHKTAVDKGWWDKERNDSEALMLMVTELAEACEAVRVGNPPDDKIPEFNGVESELADVIIRIMDFAKGRDYKVAEALVAKIEFNKSREKMHGGKKF